MVCSSVFFILSIVLSVLLRLTVSDCPFGVFKLVLFMNELFVFILTLPLLYCYQQKEEHELILSLLSSDEVESHLLYLPYFLLYNVNRN